MYISLSLKCHEHTYVSFTIITTITTTLASICTFSKRRKTVTRCSAHPACKKEYSSDDIMPYRSIVYIIEICKYNMNRMHLKYSATPPSLYN